MSSNLMVAVTICRDFGAQENSITVSIVSPSICHEVMGLDAMIFYIYISPIFLVDIFCGV